MGILTKSRDMSVFGFETETKGSVLDISVGAIKPNPRQPRKQFDTEALTSLARSISQDGVIQPLTVREKNGYYELVSGERRLRAARIAGLKTVPCIITDISDERSAVYALIENIQRADLNFFEQAEAIAQLITEHRMTQEEAALRLGLSQPMRGNAGCNHHRENSLQLLYIFLLAQILLKCCYPFIFIWFIHNLHQICISGRSQFLNISRRCIIKILIKLSFIGIQKFQCFFIRDSYSFRNFSFHLRHLSPL